MPPFALSPLVSFWLALLKLGLVCAGFTCGIRGCDVEMDGCGNPAYILPLFLVSEALHSVCYAYYTSTNGLADWNQSSPSCSRESRPAASPPESPIRIRTMGNTCFGMEFCWLSRLLRLFAISNSEAKSRAP